MARDIALLHPALQPKAKALVEAAKKKGITIIVCQTLRTKAEQNEKYAQGRTTPGKVVTNVKYPYSNHCWGVAFDICVLDKKGNADYKTISSYNTVGKLGTAMGLEWGGQWKGFLDRPHYQLPGYDSKQLKAKHGTLTKFMATWPKGAAKVADWKLSIIKEAKAAGIITGDHNPDETATKWFVLAVALKMLKKAGK